MSGNDNGPGSPFYFPVNNPYYRIGVPRGQTSAKTPETNIQHPAYRGGSSIQRSKPPTWGYTPPQVRGFAKKTLTISARRQFVPLLLGQEQVSGLIFAIANDGSNGGVNISTHFVVGVVWCMGPVASITPYINGSPPTAGFVTNYTGSGTYTPDPWLVDSIPGYADDMVYRGGSSDVNLAYSVFRIPKSFALDSFTAKIASYLTVADGSSSSWKPVDIESIINPTPMDLISTLIASPGFGLNSKDKMDIGQWNQVKLNHYRGGVINGTTVHDTKSGIVYTTPTPVKQIIGDIVDQCDLNLDFTADTVNISVDEYDIPPETDPAYPAFAAERIIEISTESENYVDGSIKFTKADMSISPNTLKYSYSNRYERSGTGAAASYNNLDQWAVDTGSVTDPNLSTTNLEESVRQLDMPIFGVKDFAEKRAITTFNQLNSETTYMSVVVFDEGIKYGVGDYIKWRNYDVVGSSDKYFRIIERSMVRPGRWMYNAREVLENTYDGTPKTNFVDLSASDPLPLPQVDNVHATYVIYGNKVRFNVVWDEQSYPSAFAYLVTIDGPNGEHVDAITRSPRLSLDIEPFTTGAYQYSVKMIYGSSESVTAIQLITVS